MELRKFVDPGSRSQTMSCSMFQLSWLRTAAPPRVSSDMKAAVTQGAIRAGKEAIEEAGESS
eukprot:11194005-Lingulodinium_polyedra.AAC.1